MVQPSAIGTPKVPVRLGLTVICAGGFMDAYSYLLHDHVFATGQTGNIVLLCMNLSEGAWLGVVRYLVSILAFVAGIMLSRHVLVRVHGRATHRMQRWVAVFEAVAFAAIAPSHSAPLSPTRTSASLAPSPPTPAFSAPETCAPSARRSTTASSRATVTSCTARSATPASSSRSASAPSPASSSST